LQTLGDTPSGQLTSLALKGTSGGQK